jgi:hypothetical protein
VVEDSGDGVEVQQCAVVVHAGKQIASRGSLADMKINMWITGIAVDNPRSGVW